MDTASHIVLAACVSNQAADAEHLIGLADEAIASTGETRKRFTADAGYYSEKNVEHVETLGSEALVPADEVRHCEWRAQRSPKGRIPGACQKFCVRSLGCVQSSLGSG